ncbi:MAG: hypothetical protein GF355_14090 [Candidatus Eisenbacteria bacterium]|nr:hypothetical protein [Candidatus Eisenbacteria bacterium]
MKGRLTILIWILGALGLAGAGNTQARSWEFLAEVPGARYTYDLTTTERGVYMTLGDSLGSGLGLYCWDRQSEELGFVGMPAEPVYGIHVAGPEDQLIWLGGDGENILWHSSSAGADWLQQSVTDYSGLYSVTGSATGNRVYIGPFHPVCLQSSVDLGDNWTAWGICDGFDYPIYAMETDGFNGDRAYALIEDNGIWATLLFETADAGTTWSQAYPYYVEGSRFGGVYPSPFQSGDVSFLTAVGNVYARESGVWSFRGYLDYGSSYGIAQPVWDGGFLWTAGLSPSNLKIRVKRETENGWEIWIPGLPDVEVTDSQDDLWHAARLWACPINGDLFLSLAGHGLWRYRNPTAGAEDPELRLSAAAMDVSPNPARGRVALQLVDLPAGTYALEIFDILGRRVRTLHSGPLGGTSSWIWEGRDTAGDAAPSGIYFLRLDDVHREHGVTRKMLWLGR